MSGLSKLMGGGAPKPTPLPELPKPEPVGIPSESDAAALAAERKAREEATTRRGRRSTQMSDRPDIQPAYTNTVLGS